MPIFAVAGDLLQVALQVLAQEGEEPQFQINLFWIIAQAASFVLFLVIVYLWPPASSM